MGPGWANFTVSSGEMPTSSVSVTSVTTIVSNRTQTPSEARKPGVRPKATSARPREEGRVGHSYCLVLDCCARDGVDIDLL